MSKPKTEREFLESLQDEELEDRLNHSYKLGISSGLEQAANLVLEKAIAYFKVHNHECDEFASRYRDIADELRKLSQAAHPGASK